MLYFELPANRDSLIVVVHTNHFLIQTGRQSSISAQLRTPKNDVHQRETSTPRASEKETRTTMLQGINPEEVCSPLMTNSSA